MVTAERPAKAPAYPIARPAEGQSDPRFTFGLALAVVRVLEAHGYPRVEAGADLLRIEEALFAAIYGGSL